jgi:hypothetical protein
MAQAQQSNAIARQQQEGMISRGRPGPVPEGIAQPDRQPEGIDQLMSNVGESYARGGIVAFSGEDSSFVQGMKSLKDKLVSTFTETPEDKQAREAREKLLQKDSPLGFFTKGASEYERDKAVAQFAAANPRLARSASFQADPAAFVKAYTAATSATPQTAKPATVTPEENINEGMRLMGRIGMAEAPVNAVTPVESKPADSLANKPPKPPKAKSTDKLSTETLPKLPPELPAPVAGSSRDILGKDMLLNPDTEMNRILEARNRLVGAPDTSQYQALIEELRGQKAKLQQKKEPGFESLMEYFGEIAAGPTVGNSGKAGAQASARLRQRELEKEKQANALSERMIETAQKQQDAVYGYKKEGFTLSEGERAKVFERRFQAAKAANESDDRARQLAQQAVLEADRIASNERVARMGAGARKGELMEVAESLMKADKTGKLTLEAALDKAARIKGTAAIGGNDIRALKDKEAALEKLADKFPKWSRTGPSKTAVEARKEYETEKARIEAAYGGIDGAGLNSLPATTGGVKILSIEPSPK